MKKIIQVLYTLYAWIINVSLWSIGYFVSIISTIGTKDKESKYNAIERMFTRISFRLLGINLEVKGLENIPDDEPVIFVSNHQSFIDVKLSIALYPEISALFLRTLFSKYQYLENT